MTTTNNKIIRYVILSRLSKLAAYGVIDKRPGTTKQNFRWAAKPAANDP